jgi:uncharacterized protein YutE (UPF0331/DUF86 family)
MSLDKPRILSKFDEINGYLEELEKIIPQNLEDYVTSVKDKRACERLLQISLEVVIDVCNILISNLKLGLPEDEEAVFEKLVNKKIISNKLKSILNGMKGLRNILVHKYGEVDDELVFEVLSEKLGDFEIFKKEILEFLNKN